MQTKFDDFVGAQAQYEACLRLAPNQAGHRVNYAGLLKRRGRLEEARAQFDAAMRIDSPPLAVARLNYSQLLAGELLDMAGARAQLAAGLREHPCDPHLMLEALRMVLVTVLARRMQASPQ